MKDMFRLVVRIVQLQFFLLFVYILCNWIAGPKNAVPWFVFVSLTLLGLVAYGMIIRHRQR
jgi:ABC-type multidrug transport system permease subunit